MRYGVLSPAAGDSPEFQRRMNKLSLTKALSLSVFCVGCRGVSDINREMAMRGQAAPCATDRKMVRSCYGSHDCGRLSLVTFVSSNDAVFDHFCGLINQYSIAVNATVGNRRGDHGLFFVNIRCVF